MGEHEQATRPGDVVLGRLGASGGGVARAAAPRGAPCWPAHIFDTN